MGLCNRPLHATNRNIDATLSLHVIENTSDFSEDVFNDKQEQLINIDPNLAISEIIKIVRSTNLKLSVAGTDNNATLLEFEIARCENENDYTSI